METRKIFSYSILKINKNRLLLTIKYKYNNLYRERQLGLVSNKKKLCIFKNQIYKIIKEYYNKP